MKIHLTAAVWHANFYDYLGRAFRELGHDVLFFNEAGNRPLVILRKILLRLAKSQYKVDDRFRYLISRAWLDSIKNFHPDLIMLEYAPNILPEFISKARNLKKPIFYWVTSPPGAQQSKDLLLGLTFADKIFSIDREWIPLVARFSKGGEVNHLPLAGAEEVFHPLWGAEEKNRRTIYDVCFVGSFSPQNASAVLRAYYLSQIPEHYKIAVYGSGLSYWSRYFPRLSKAMVSDKHLGSQKLNEVYNISKIVLNIHSPDHLKSISARTFEIALAGGFQIVDWREDLDLLFPAGTFSTFKTSREMIKLIEYWIDKPEERRQMAEKAREVTLKNHTWRKRAQMILAQLDK